MEASGGAGTTRLDDRLPVRLVRQVEDAQALDEVGATVGKTVRNTIAPGAIKDALSGTWLGHALHPLLSATILDLLGGDRDGKASERLIAVGIATYPPTAVTGANDWADTEVVDPRIRRVGLAHAAANVAGLAFYAASLSTRRRGRRA